MSPRDVHVALLPLMVMAVPPGAPHPSGSLLRPHAFPRAALILDPQVPADCDVHTDRCRAGPARRPARGLGPRAPLQRPRHLHTAHPSWRPSRSSLSPDVANICRRSVLLSSLALAGVSWDTTSRGSHPDLTKDLARGLTRVDLKQISSGIGTRTLTGLPSTPGERPASPPEGERPWAPDQVCHPQNDIFAPAPPHLPQLHRHLYHVSHVPLDREDQERQRSPHLCTRGSNTHT